MPSKSRLFSQLIAGSGQIKADRLSDDISTIEQVASTEDLTAVGNTIGDQRVINNNLYIWNGSGWYRIALINASPTWDSGGQPGSSYELDADSPQDPTIITLAASDPDGLSISYNYITSGSMDSMATISQDSSVFTITPKTVTEVGEGVELTGSITFRATDGVNILPQVSSFTLNFISIIENSNYTTLLAAAVDTSDNNNITDASSNSHSITVNGDVNAGAFSPYRSGGYSTYFDGNDHLTATHTNPLGTADFTVEGWINFDNVGGNRTFITLDDSAQLYFRNSGSSIAIYGISGGTYNFSTGTPDANTWYHFAFVRQSGSITLYWDGQSKGSVGCTDNFNSGNLHIGCWSAISEFFQGHLADIKISSTAVYTSNFSVPTERLSSDSSTQLITCHLPYIADGSNLNETIVVNGDPTTKPFSPYDHLEYLATDHGGSVYFDGTGDGLEISDSDDFDLSGGSWTIECWWYPITVNTYDGVFSQWNGPSVASGRNINVTWESDKLYLFGYNGGTFISSLYHDVTASVLQKKWNHIAAVFDGTKTELYLNGKASGRAYVSSTNLSKNVTAPFRVAKHHRLSSYHYSNSYISDVRVNKGTAVYTSDFIPPTAPLSSSGTSLHIKGTDASIIDKAQGGNLTLIGDTTGSTTQVKFSNTKSMYFDGSGDYIAIPDNEAYGFGTGDWTIETWLYCTKTGGFNAIFDTRVGTGTETGSFGIGMYNTGRVQLFSGGILYYPTNSLSFNTWQHFAVVKNSGTTTMYFNGTAASTTYSDSRNYGSSQPVQIGKDDTTSNYFGGYMQDFRITKGLARYTANFTPPTEPLEG